ncbi:uncharacterized protein LOC114269225 [Camellia sinensis]|uniref:uncharacterized protein LOC114269225 n=1 Tax=Camellia sinensis TaxID=4442 RepID=UPI001035AD40|nr:uncharacterized protein LOC114269225 [Camellia sinensis]
MMEPQPADGSALVTKASNPVAVKSDRQQSNAYSSGVGGNNGLPEGSRAGNKDSLWCTYCKKPRHSRERCWKPHGKPSNTKNNPWTAKSNQGGGPGQAHLTSTQSGGEGEFSQEQSEFNREEIEKLRYFLGTLKKPTGCAGTCSLALSGNSQPYALNVSTLKGTWVVYSGATDHMTQSCHGFVSYNPCPSNKS